MGHRLAAVLAIAIAPSIASYSDFPACERWQRRWEVECLQAIYESALLPSTEKHAERRRLSEAVCPELEVAASHTCPPFDELPIVTPTFDRWLQRWMGQWSQPPPPPPPPACIDGPNCV
jgi:hypothetical protein